MADDVGKLHFFADDLSAVRDRTGEGTFAAMCRKRSSMDWTRTGETSDRGARETMGNVGDKPVLVEVRRMDSKAVSINNKALVTSLYIVGDLVRRSVSSAPLTVGRRPASTAAACGLSSRGDSGRRRDGDGPQ